MAFFRQALDLLAFGFSQPIDISAFFSGIKDMLAFFSDKYLIYQHFFRKALDLLVFFQTNTRCVGIFTYKH